MKFARTTLGLYKPKNIDILRGIKQTANSKQVEAAAILDNVDVRSEWDMAKPVTAIPGPKPLPIPHVGNIWRLMPIFSKWGTDMMQMHKDLYDQYGPIVRIVGMGRADMILLYDSADVEKMFRNETSWPERMALESLKYYRTVYRKDFYGEHEGLVTSQREAWQKFRTATNQTMMQPRNILMYLDSVSAVADDFVERIRYIRKPNQEMPDDFICELNKFALESVGVMSLDTRFGCLANDLDANSETVKLIDNAKNVLALMHKLEFGGSPWKLFPTSTWRKFLKTMDELLELTIKYTNEKWETIKQKGEKEDTGNKSILETLLLRTKDPKIPIVMTTDAIFAGIDTTSNATATVLYHLAINPEKQEKLFSELKTFLPEKNTKITKEIFNELKYLRAVIKESMRLKPTAGANQRMSKKDMVFQGYQIPSGSCLIAAHQIMCQMEKHFKNPNEFLPERWLRNNSELDAISKPTNPFVFLPFGFGQRSCIGKRIAELEIEMVVTKIIRNFRFSYHYEPMTWVSRLVTAPAKPLRFKVVDRSE